MSVRPSVCLSLKISVTTELMGFYSSWNIPPGPVVVLSYFLGGWDTPNPIGYVWLVLKKNISKDFLVEILSKIILCLSKLI